MTKDHSQQWSDYLTVVAGLALIVPFSKLSEARELVKGMARLALYTFSGSEKDGYAISLAPAE